MKTLLRFFLSERYLSNNDIENDWYGELCLNKIEDNGYVVIPRIGDTVVLDYESAVGKYEIQVSTDGSNYQTVYTKNEDTVTSEAQN